MSAKLRVAIVDDEPVVLQVLSDVITGTPGLALAGQAEDGRSGLRLCERCDPDVVVADLRMPGGGIPFIRALRSQSSRRRIIVHSAHVSDATSTPLLEAGADDVVAKSASIRGLIRSIVGA